MSFEKKTWENRQVEYPYKRALHVASIESSDPTPEIKPGDVIKAVVVRDEGEVTAVGDAFSAENMNDLEDRIAAGFASLTTPTAAQVSYDNTNSGLVSTDVQGAIDELDGELDSIKTDSGYITGSGYVALKDFNQSDNFNIGTYAVAFGESNVASGSVSFAQGTGNTASGSRSHVEGERNVSSGYAAHAEGQQCTASGYAAHAEGNHTEATASYSHAEGAYTEASGGTGAHAEGYQSVASWQSAHAEGQETISSGLGTHSEGEETVASGTASHAEGMNTTSSSNGSHSEGQDTIASNPGAHAEGGSSVAAGLYSHAEGDHTSVGQYAAAGHAEGFYTQAGSIYSHAGGMSCIQDQTFGEGGAFYIYPTPGDYFEETETEYRFLPGTTLTTLVIKFLDNAVPHFESMVLQAGAGIGGVEYLDENGQTLGDGGFNVATQTTLDIRHPTTVTLQTPLVMSVPAGNTTPYVYIAKSSYGSIASSGGDINYVFASDAITMSVGASSFAHGFGVSTATVGQAVFGSLNDEDSKKAFIIGNGYVSNVRGSGDPEYIRSNAMSIDWCGNQELAGKLSLGAGPKSSDDAVRLTDLGTTIAPLFSALSTYAVDDYVIYEGVLYKCDTAVTTAGDFDPSDWSAVRIVTEMGSGGGGSTTLAGLSDVSIVSATDGQVLTYDSANSKWKNAAGGGGSSTLSGLTDVTVSSATDGQALVYDSSTSKWVNDTIPTGATALTGLSDVTISSATDGQSLVYDANSSKWVNGAGGGGSSTLSGLNDVTITSATGGQVITYDSANSKWVNLAPALPWVDIDTTLTAGSTSVTVQNAAITTSSAIFVLTPDGTEYNDITVTTGQAVITFDAQASNLAVKVRVS